MKKYTSMGTTIRDLLAGKKTQPSITDTATEKKPEVSITDTPEVSDLEMATDPDPTDNVDLSQLHPRMHPAPKAHSSVENVIKHHLLRNIRAQQKMKIIDGH